MRPGDQGASIESSWLASRAALIAASILTIVCVGVLYVGADWPLVVVPLLANGVVLILWLISAVGIGLQILRPMKLDCGNALRAVLATSLGLGIISLLVLGLGCAGAMNHWTAVLILFFGIACTATHLKQFAKPTAWPWASLKQPAHFHWLWLSLMPLLSIALTCAMIPPGMLWRDEPNGYDVTEYHLQVPREWFEIGRILPLHHNVFSFFPFNVEMHFLLAMNLRGGPWAGMYLAQLMHVSFIALTVLAIYALLAETHPRRAIIASCIAGATPWLTLLAPVAYDEGGLLLFGTLAIGLCLRAMRVDRPMKWMMLAGAMGGFACGSKLTAVPAIVIPLTIIVVIAPFILRMFPSQQKAQGWLSLGFAGKRSIIAASTFLIPALITFSPWLIRNTIWCGNPVFPEATSIFGKAHWTDTQVERWKRANHLPRDDQQNIPGQLRAAWDQILGDGRFNYALLPLGIFALAMRRDRESLVLGLLLLFQAIFWLFFTHLQSRFFVLSIPICALAIGKLSGQVWELILTACALILTIVGTLWITLKIAAIERELGKFEIHLFSVAGLPTLRDFSRLPMAEDGRIVELVGEGQAFLYDVPTNRLYYRTVFDVDAQPGESAEQAWRKGWPPDGPGVNVIRNGEELDRFHRTYWGIPAQ